MDFNSICLDFLGRKSILQGIKKGEVMETALEQFKTYIESFTEEDLPSVIITSHDNPDPDALGSALGMQRLIKFWNNGIKTSIVYGGEISHPQNKTMVNILNINPTHKKDFKVQNKDSDKDKKESKEEPVEDGENGEDGKLVFVVVDCLPERALEKVEGVEGLKSTFVIDHHKVDTKKSKFKDIRAVGATSSIVWEYFQKEGLELDKDSEEDADIATALVVGIKSDTSDLSSDNVTDLDFEAYKNLIGFVNQRKLALIIKYPLPPYHFELRSRLEKEGNSTSDNGVFIGGIGYIVPSKRDALPTIADERARVEGIDTSFIFAVVGDNIEVSVRSNGLSLDVNSICQNLFGKEYGGGKMGSGAAKISMGVLSIENDPAEIQEKMWEAIRDKMTHKIISEMSRYR